MRNTSIPNDQACWQYTTWPTKTMKQQLLPGFGIVNPPTEVERLTEQVERLTAKVDELLDRQHRADILAEYRTLTAAFDRKLERR